MMVHVCDIEDYSCLNGLCDLFLNDVEECEECEGS